MKKRLFSLLINFIVVFTAVAQVPSANHNPVLKGYFADPEVLFSQKTSKYYLYPTSDGFDNWSGDYFKVFSSDNLVDWKDEGVILDLKKDVKWASLNAWAPCIIEKKINGSYKYFYYFCAAQKIGVAVADNPTGPFTDSGNPLIDHFPKGVTNGQQIDPDVFTDPDTGKSYFYWGNGYMAGAELNDDMVSLKPETVRILTPDATFREGVYVFARKGTTYFMWSEDDTRSPNYKVRYATSKSPLGKLEIPENNVVIKQDAEKGIYATGHNSVLQIPGKDDWYLVYHRFTVPDGIKMGPSAGFHREVCIDKMTFDGERIVQVKPTLEGISPISKEKPIDAVVTINANQSLKISDHLFGIFFEDINYAADGGLYAELVQNRSFEYSPADHSGWNPLTSWQYTTKGFGYGTISVETNQPIHPNNPHYMVVNVEDEGKEGVGLTNSGYDGIVIKNGEKYNFSAFVRQISDKSIPFQIRLLNKKGEVCGEGVFTSDSKDWKKYSLSINAIQGNDSCSLAILAKAKGKFAIDVVSLFPEKTFKNRPNGLREDLAQTISDLRPKFIRFPGGCLVHGDGLGNMYRWKNTIGPIEQRVEQKNIWNYHQSVGLGYFEFFQYCEDIGSKPLPVLPAAVSCQNSGGTWSIGGTGQRGLPMDEMKEYIQEVLDLVEFANGPVTSTWGAKRAAAGHPQPFNLEYVGIGNEDKQTPEFRERYKMIADALKVKHPEITIVGTVGPAPDGEDFDLGWKFANENKVQVVDEHYYKDPKWFFENLNRYDSYNRKTSGVYVGEFAAHDVKRRNTLRSALAEAACMTSLERNGDIVKMASYAPLLAKYGNTQWTPDMIYFSNTTIRPTVNYYVQQLYGQNSGDESLFSNVSLSGDTKALANQVPVSVVKESKSGDVIIKMVNNLAKSVNVTFKLNGIKPVGSKAIKTVLTGDPDEISSKPEVSECTINQRFNNELPANSFTVIRTKTKKY